MKKRFYSLCLAFIMLVALVGGCAKSPSDKATQQQDKEPYRIGAVVDISGGAASLGEPERDTLKMLVDDLNAKGGINGHPVELTILDNKSLETEAVLAAKRLIDQNKVLAVLGCSASGTSLAMIDTVQKANVPMISMAASAKIVEPVKDRYWVFKTAQSDIVVANKIAKYLAAKGIKDVAFLSMNNAFGDSGRVNFEKAAPANGLNIVLAEKFEATDKDMTSQLAKVKASKAQATVVWAIPPSAAIITKNFRDLGLDMPLIQTHGIGNKAFLDLAGDAANGVIAPMGKLVVAEQLPDSDPQKAALLAYISSYEKKFNARPSTFGGHAHDAFNLAVKAIGEAGPDRQKIRDALEQTTGFVGISGVFNLSAQDHNGLGEDSMVMVEIKDGQWKLLE
ncbi:ABC transporter substrate-binding protein [Desulforudis sp. 1088]|uniref:ABC transporter substrate-binding protein n=2 Tax=Candidatus Desulforudis TaxID=471826 RepID=UPI003CE53533